MLQSLAVRLPNTAAMSTPSAMKRDLSPPCARPFDAAAGEVPSLTEAPALRVWNGVPDPMDDTDLGTELCGFTLRDRMNRASAMPATTMTTSAVMIASTMTSPT